MSRLPHQKSKPLHKYSNVVFGTDLTLLKPTHQFTLCAASVLVLYLLYGYVQEKLFRIPGFRSHGWYLSLIQFIFVTFFSYVDSKFISKSSSARDVPPYYEFMVLSWLTVGTMGLSTVALGFLNFPTQVIFKSCKVIPVMIGGIFILGKKYKLLDYAAVLSMSVGLVWFSLADQTVSPEFEVKGIILISLALVVDAVYGNYQEKLMRRHPHMSNADIVFYSYSYGTVMIFTWLISTGQLLPSVKFVSQNTEVYGLACMYSTLGYVGQQFVLALIKSSGALVSSIVTTMRKVLTIILSFFFFTKPFTSQYVWSGSLVLLGIFISIYTRNKEDILLGLTEILRSTQKFLNSHSTPRSSQEKLVQQV